MVLKSINPFNGELIEEFEEFSSEKINSLVDDSAKAFLSWKRVSFEEKRVLMHRAADVLAGKKENRRQDLFLSIYTCCRDLYQILIVQTIPDLLIK